MTEETFSKKCPGCENILHLNKKSFELMKQLDEQIYEKIINSQYCSGECARKIVAQNDEIFRSKK